ncbi:MAG: phosphoribosylanthranilate isomerase [Oscillospiraceae bacterium]|nr:phosphoribosylanthranilate isomerase [Oscillospiraceae bacterium]
MKIKICGLYRSEDVDFVNEALPDYAGFVLNFPKSHRNISLNQAEFLKNRLDKRIQSVGVFVDAPIDYIEEAARRKIIDIVQLHGSENADFIAKLKRRVPLPVIRAVKVDGSEIEPLGADFLLLDSGKGTGKTFDHALICPEIIPVPFFIAGGITPEKIPDLARFEPFGADISGGVETDKIKDREKILAAVKAARSV